MIDTIQSAGAAKTYVALAREAGVPYVTLMHLKGQKFENKTLNAMERLYLAAQRLTANDDPLPPSDAAKPPPPS